jgi:hypothetical protein
MPYIKEHDRLRLSDVVNTLKLAPVETSGELNYLFTVLAQAYVKRHGKKYGILNDVVGAFEGAKAEFQRRIVNPYEDTKIAENGDVNGI